MRSKLLDLIEVVCLLLVAVAVGALLSPWWGVLVAGIEGVVYVNLLGDGSSRPGDN